jgi:tetratricopeptide (TPR) repeat protein
VSKRNFSFRFSLRLLPVGLLLCWCAFFAACSGSDDKKSGTDSVAAVSPYLNHSDSARYVGMNTCKGCHLNIYETFIHTGMGRSFDTANTAKTSASFGSNSTIYDKYRNLWYHSYFSGGKMYISEYRLEGRDTTYKRTEQVDYIVGSGQHTNSHIYSVNGYLFQMPMTFYTQKGKWDLPPGFEDGHNSRFDRKIGLECMSCHNTLPGFVKGSENQFTEIPDGITCERCHGPGSIHVQQKMAGDIIDTSKFIDYSIVNPGKLQPDLQFDVCQRCHLQGNAVLQPGKSFFDFKPGMKLNSVMTVFMPKYEGAEDEFIMASHAERLKMSACFIQSQPKPGNANELRPARSSFTCVTCHNPHVTVKETGSSAFNAKCMGCHTQGSKQSKLHGCTAPIKTVTTAQNNCVSCHMPRSGSIDIPHVTVHDHWIRRPVPDSDAEAKKTTAEVKKFLGLYAVNDDNPSAQTRGRAYLQQFEKFTADPQYLDSAKRYLPDATVPDLRGNFCELVQLSFLRNDFAGVTAQVNRLGVRTALDTVLVRESWDNYHAWAAYRIGESFYKTGNAATAELFYKKATDLAPFHPDFRAKYGLTLAVNKKNFEARAQLQMVLDAYPKHVQANTNLGYLWLLEGNDKKAEQCYQTALKYDPDDDQALLNMAGLQLFRGNKAAALTLVNQCLKVHPENEQAKQLQQQLKQSNP